MSINKLLFEEENRNDFVQDSKSTLKQVLGLGGLAAVLGTAMSKSSTKAYEKNKSTKTTKLGEAGVRLKSSIDDAFTKRTTRDLASANQFFDSLIEESSSILKRTVKNGLEDTPELSAERKMMQKAIINEKTYLLTAVRDAVRDLNITGEAGNTNMLIERIEKILDGEMRSVDELSESVEEVLRSIRNNTTNDKKIQQFKKFKALKENSKYFSGKAKAINVSEGMLSMNRRAFSNLTDAFRGSFAISQGIDINADLDNVKINDNVSGYFKTLENDFQQFNRALKEHGGRVSRFTVMKEHERELGSIYMHVADNKGKEINYKFGLHFSNVKGARKVMRGTGSLNTPFVIPSFMPHLQDIQNLLKSPASTQDLTNLMRRSTPERFVQKSFLDYLFKSGGFLSDLSERDINKYADMVRAQGISINRASLYPQTNNPLGHKLSQGLALQQTLSSYQGIIYGAESISQKEAQKIPILLQEKFGDFIDAPAASQAPLRKVVLPKIGELRGINFNLLKLGDETGFTPYTLMRTFGYKTRGSLPLTARESQFFGREDILSSLITPGKKRPAEGSSGFFGKSKMNMIASNSNLLQVDPKIGKLLEDAPRGALGHVQGANMAGIIFFKEGQGLQAGLGEGMGYYGSSIEVEIPIQKSVLDPDKMNQPEFAFLRNLIEKRKKNITSIEEYKYKGDKLKEAFKVFGNEKGEIPLGMIDNRISGLKNLTGMQEFILQIDPIEGVLEDKGRYKYAIEGKVRLQSDANKLFGAMGRLTSYGDPITKQQAISIIEQSFGDQYSKQQASSIAKDLFTVYEQGFGGKMQNLIITDSSALTKASDFVRSFMYGGYRMLGGEDKALKLDSLVEEDIRKLAMQLEGNAFNNSENQIRRAELIDFTKRLIKGLKTFKEMPSTAAVAALIAPIEYLSEEGKFGLQKGDLFKNVLDELKVPYDKKEFEKVFATGAAIGATSMFSGSPSQILGRNMAKFEPRHANILMYGMRSFFGLNTEQSVKYLNDFILRQEGIEYSGKYLPDIVSLGMSFKSKMNKSIDNKAFNKLSQEEFDFLATSARTITKVDPTKADQFRQNLISVLDRETPSVLRISDVVKDKANLEKLSKIIPSGQIVIPSGETIEGMINYQIQKGEKVENIDSRLIANLKGVFDNLSQIDYDTRPSNRIKALTSISEDITEMTALALRRSISGSVAGSVTMQGSAVVLNDKFKSQGFKDIDLKNMQRIFEKEKAYTVFTNTKGFMDSLNTFMGAATKTKEISEKDALTKTIDKYKHFMFEHMSDDMKATRTLVFRNPSMSVTHMLPGVNVGRADISNIENIKPTLSKENVSFLESMVGQVDSSDKSLKSVLNETEVVDGARQFKTISPESVFKLEQAFQKNPELAKKVASMQANTYFQEFQKHINSFYGTNVPLGLKTFTATEEGVTSAIETLKGEKYKESKVLMDAMGSLRRMRSSIGKPEKATKGAFNNIYKNIVENYGKTMGVGGGALIFPTFESEIKLSGGKTLNTRLDFSYSMIGDFDADIYQMFHETKDISSKALVGKSGEAIRQRLVEASVKFSVIRNLIDQAYNTLGKSLGADNMALAAFKADQAKKEVILKNVGGVDVQFKSMLLGLVENSLQATPEGKQTIAYAAQAIEYIGDAALAAGSTQDIGVIKAKKLPFAVEIGEILGNAMRRGLETENTDDFVTAFKQLILNNSPELSRGVTIENLQLKGATEGVNNFYKGSVEGMRIEGEKILQAMVEGLKTSSRQKLYVMGAERKIDKMLQQSGGQLKGSFENFIMNRNALELGLLGEGGNFKESTTALEKVETMLDNVINSASRTKSGVISGLSGKGMAGLIGAGLVSSYALGASYSTSALSGPDKFSDMKVKEQISQRAIYNNMNYQHKDIPTQNMRPQENFYQRPITGNEMYVNKPSSIAIRGNASNIGDAQKVLQQVSSMGGRGHLSIQDNVLPRPNLVDYYMRDK